ncbi:unnamed protein product, partial [Prorocentrum cordatum]
GSAAAPAAQAPLDASGVRGPAAHAPGLGGMAKGAGAPPRGGRGVAKRRLKTTRMADVQVRESTIKGAGMGLFANVDMPRGTRLPAPYRGRRLTLEQFKRLKDPRWCYTLDEGRHWAVDGKQLKRGNPLRYVNGARTPAQRRRVNVVGLKIDGQPWFVTTSLVKKGSEFLISELRPWLLAGPGRAVVPAAEAPRPDPRGASAAARCRQGGGAAAPRGGAGGLAGQPRGAGLSRAPVRRGPGLCGTACGRRAGGTGTLVGEPRPSLSARRVAPPPALAHHAPGATRARHAPRPQGILEGAPASTPRVRPPCLFRGRQCEH